MILTHTDIQQYPLMAFTGVPGELTISSDVQKLQRYMQWSEYVMSVNKENIIKKHLKRPFIVAHLRIGADMVREINMVPLMR